MTTNDESSRDGEATAADDPVVVDLDAPEPDPGDTPAPTGRSPRLRTLATVAVLVGVLALGVFIGQVNARNATANDLRVVPGDLVVNGLLTDDSRWKASLTVINGGEQPVDVIGMEVPGFDLAMTAESVTVPSGERAAAEVTLTPDCDTLPEGTASTDGTAPPNGPAEPRPLALEATTDEGEHTLETSVMIAPDHSLAMFTRACTRRNEDIASQLEVT